MAEIQTTPPPRVENVNGITLGVEFEFAINDGALNRRIIAEQMREAGLNVYGLYTYGASRHEDSLQSWVVKSDSTIKPDDNSHLAVEIVSPILRINEFDNQVRIATNVFESIGGYIPGQRRRTTNVGPTCGLHLHVGGLSTSMKCQFAAEYMRHEKAIDSILAPSRRGRLPGFSKGYLPKNAPLGNQSICLRERGYNLGTLRSATNPGSDRYRNVNNETGTKKTTELRQHQGTIDYDKTKHWKRFNACHDRTRRFPQFYSGINGGRSLYKPNDYEPHIFSQFRRRHERIYQFARRRALTIERKLRWQ